MTVEMIYRQQAIAWFNKLTLEQKFYKTIEANNVITGDKTRHPNSLTGREIEAIYEYHENK